MPNINIKLTEEEYAEISRCKCGEDWKEHLFKTGWFAGILKYKPKFGWGEEWGFKHVEPINKPCHSCGYCPYGQTVEAFPIENPRGELSCNVFGHDCPAYYMAEPLSEGVIELNATKYDPKVPNKA